MTALPDMRFPDLQKAEARTNLRELGVSSIAEARMLSGEELLKRWAATMPGAAIQRTPVVDGYVLPNSLDKMAAAGDYRHVPCLIGYNADEGIPPSPTYEQFADQIRLEYGMEQGERFLALCPKAEYESYKNVYFTEHLQASAEAWALLLERQNVAPVYVYCLDRKLPGDHMGAFHAADLWYVFQTFFRGWRPWTGADYELAVACNSYWANFARYGDPNSSGRPKWPPYTAGNPASMELGERIGLQYFPDNERVSFRREFLLNR